MINNWITITIYQHPTLQVSEMEAFVDFNVAGGDLLEGSRYIITRAQWMMICSTVAGPSISNKVIVIIFFTDGIPRLCWYWAKPYSLGSILIPVTMDEG